MTRRGLFVAALVLAAVVRPAAQDVPAVVVEEVPPGSVAAKAGLAPGDRILEYDGTSIVSPASLQAGEENTFKPAVAVVVHRDGKALTLSAPAGRLGLQVRPAIPPAALALYEKGRAAQRDKQIDEAISHWASARAAIEASDAATAAWLYGRIGLAHEGARRWKEASTSHEAAWQILRSGTDVAAQSRTLWALGRSSYNANDFPSATRWYEQGLQVDLTANYRVWAGNALTQLGAIAFNRSELPEAQAYFSRALAIREAIDPDSLDVAFSIHNQGNVAYVRGDLALARTLFARALDIRLRLAPDTLDVASSRNNLGLIDLARGNVDDAERNFQQAVAIRERLAPETLALANNVYNLGRIAQQRGDFALALARHTRASELRERLSPGSLDVAGSLRAIGLIHLEFGDADSAGTAFSRSLAIVERLAPNSLDVADTAGALALVARARGDLAGAETLFARAIAHYERVAPNTGGHAELLNNLGNVVEDRADLAAAGALYSRALAIHERSAPESLSIAMSLNNLGLVAYRRQDLVAADSYLQRSLSMKEKVAPNSLTLASTLQNLGHVARARRDVAQSQDYLLRAFTIGDRVAPQSLIHADTLTGLGEIAQVRSDLVSAEAYHRRALEVYERLQPVSVYVAQSLHRLGEVAAAERRYTAALELLSRAADIVESQRWRIGSTDARAFLFERSTELYVALLRTQLALDDRPGAFLTAERIRSRSFLDMLTEARAGIRTHVDPTLLDREQRLQQDLNAKANRHSRTLAQTQSGPEAARAAEDLNASLKAYRELQAQIRSSNPRYADLVQPQPIALADVQRHLLDDDTILLEYVLGDDGSFVFLVTPASSRVFELPARGDIDRAARRVHELMTARQPRPGESVRARQLRVEAADASYPAAAAHLSRMVLGPVAGHLGRARLLIVADGALQYVPFSALPDPSPPARPAAASKGPAEDARPLVVDHEIVSLPSASVLATLREQRRDRAPVNRLVAVLADPVFDAADPRLRRDASTSAAPQAAPLTARVAEAVRAAGIADERGAIARLPFTRDEARAILALAPAGQAMQAVDFAASRATVTGPELAQYRVVHLATHGLLDTQHPELSGLVLSQVDAHGQPQDGFLRLHEIYNLGWGSELVVLSACQTGLGQEIRGEGLVGLTRGFMYAGSERVMASLWNVNDRVTAQLMTRFYDGLFAKKLSPAAALRAAQVEMWKQQPWRAPYYWAAFVLQGEWR